MRWYLAEQTSNVQILFSTCHLSPVMLSKDIHAHVAGSHIGIHYAEAPVTSNISMTAETLLSDTYYSIHFLTLSHFCDTTPFKQVQNNFWISVLLYLMISFPSISMCMANMICWVYVSFSWFLSISYCSCCNYKVNILLSLKLISFIPYFCFLMLWF